jgi:hypothetical protein
MENFNFPEIAEKIPGKPLDNSRQVWHIMRAPEMVAHTEQPNMI